MKKVWKHLLILCSAAVVLCVCILAVMLIRAIFGPLKELAGAADRVAAGDFDVDVRETGSGDEIAVVTHAFRKMLFSIREYIERQRASMEKESRMKENALAMQAAGSVKGEGSEELEQCMRKLFGAKEDE